MQSGTKGDFKFAKWWLDFIHPWFYNRLKTLQKDTNVNLIEFNSLKKQYLGLFRKEFK